MKRRLNLLCTVLIIGFGAQLLIQSFYLIPEAYQAFKDGYEAGTHMGEKALEQNNTDHFFKGEESLPVELTLRPKSYTSVPDSLYNTKTGEWIPVTIEKITVECKREVSLLQNIFVIIIGILYIIGLLLAFTGFVQLLLGINRSVIFEWVNVKRLRKIGIGFLVAFLCHLCMGYVSVSFAWEYISLTNYEISHNELMNGINLVFGFISLLLAEVFAIGLRIRKQQELTI